MVQAKAQAVGARGGVEQWNSRTVEKREGKEFLVLSFWF